MNFQVKFAFVCIAICAALSSVVANNNLRGGEACLVQYLRAKGKLSENFRSSQQPSSQCRLITPLTVQIIKTAVNDLITKGMPDAADCLIEEFGNKESVDYLIQINVVEMNEAISATDRRAQLRTTRNDLRKELKEIATHCETDRKDFISVFNEALGIKNESLAVVQQEYCLAKYVADNNVIDFGNVDINPERIDANSVDCDGIVEADRRSNEKEVTDKIRAAGKGGATLSCIINYYRNNNVYDSIVGLKVITRSSASRQKKEIETNRLSQNVGQFAVAMFSCPM